MEDLTGKQFGLYQVVAPLGKGGMAAVYKAYQPSIDRYVALKVLPRHFADDPQFIKRFEQEAKLLAKLQHPHILPIHDYGESEGYTYMVMPWVTGGDLTRLFRTRQFSLAEIGRIISQVGDALDYAHTQGVIHRDVKPSNILIDVRGNCLLTDFGIAKLVEGTSNLTGTGGVIGTPSYMSPEQGLGQTLDGRSDIYSLGIILYEMVTGQVPFTAETPMAVVIQHIQTPLPPPSKLDPTMPEAIERVILKSLAKQPEDRYATPGDMVQALQAAIGTETSFQPTKNVTIPRRLPDMTKLDKGDISKEPAIPPSPAAKTSRPSGFNSMILWGVVSIFLILVLGLGLLGVWWGSRPDRAEAPPASAPQTDQPASDQSQLDPLPGQPHAPPPEAIEACRQAREGDACTANTRRGTVTGTCLPILSQLACIPAGGPPPGP